MRWSHMEKRKHLELINSIILGKCKEPEATVKEGHGLLKEQLRMICEVWIHEHEDGETQKLGFSSEHGGKHRTVKDSTNTSLGNFPYIFIHPGAYAHS